MTGENWSPAILLLAAALSLAIAPKTYRLQAVLAMLGSAVLACLVAYPPGWQQPILAGSWISITICALLVYRRPEASPAPSLMLAANAGFWAGAVSASFGSERDLLLVLPLTLLAFPAGWVATRGASITLKILASWIIAITILIASLPLVATPGYVQDHMN